MITVSEKSLITQRACSIIFSNEGDYGSVNLDDNGAVSIGKVQWHGNRALELLKTIITFDNTTARVLLKDDLFNEIFSCLDWGTRTVNQDEANKISELLTTANGMSAQDSLACTDVLTYVNKGISYGLSNPEALIYFADGVNQYGTYSSLWQNIVIEALKKGGTLDAMFEATNRLCTSNLDRRASVYEKLRTEAGGLVVPSEPITDIIKITPDLEMIKSIQKWCNDYRFAGIVVDGIYGYETQKAIVQCLQYYINNNEEVITNRQEHSLNEDGLWGPATAKVCPYVSLGHNQNTKLAFIAQSLLYLNGYDPIGLDSNFGANSAKAAMLFQTDNNIYADGAVGVLTFSKLLL